MGESPTESEGGVIPGDISKVTPEASMRRRRHALSDWQLIATASKRGTAMLLTGKDSNGLPWLHIGHYANGWTCNWDFNLHLEPTHWMPMPKLPESEAE